MYKNVQKYTIVKKIGTVKVCCSAGCGSSNTFKLKLTKLLRIAFSISQNQRKETVHIVKVQDKEFLDRIVFCSRNVFFEGGRMDWIAISVGTIAGTLCTNAFQRSYQRSPSWKYCTVWNVGNISSTRIFRCWRKVYTIQCSVRRLETSQGGLRDVSKGSQRRLETSQRRLKGQCMHETSLRRLKAKCMHETSQRRLKAKCMHETSRDVSCVHFFGFKMFSNFFTMDLAVKIFWIFFTMNLAVKIFRSFLQWIWL